VFRPTVRNRARRRQDDEGASIPNAAKTQLRSTSSVPMSRSLSPSSCPPDWARGIFDAIERSRNAIMHSGVLDPEDIERVGVNLRDWIRQVGA
jgi:hypothetical protein